MNVVLATFLRAIAQACVVAANEAPPGTSRRRQGYSAAWMLEHEAVAVEREAP